MAIPRTGVIGRSLRGFVMIAVAFGAGSAAACSGLHQTISRAPSVNPPAASGALPPLASLGEKPLSRQRADPALPGPPTSGISAVKFSPDGKTLAVTRVAHGIFRLLIISLQGKVVRDLGNIPDDDIEWDTGGQTIYYRVPVPTGTPAARAKALGLGAVTLSGKRFTMLKPEEQSYFLSPVPGGGISFLVKGAVKKSRVAESMAHALGRTGMAIWAWDPGHPARELTPAEFMIPPWTISSRGGIAFVERAGRLPVGELHQYERGRDRVVAPISKARFMGGYGLRWRGLTGIYCVWVVWVPGPKTEYSPAHFGDSSHTGTLGWIDVATGKLHPVSTVEKARKLTDLPPSPAGALPPDVILRIVRWNKSEAALVMVGTDWHRSLKVMTPSGVFKETANGGWIGSPDWSPSGRLAAFEVDGAPGVWDQASGKVRWITVSGR